MSLAKQRRRSLVKEYSTVIPNGQCYLKLSGWQFSDLIDEHDPFDFSFGSLP
jgi:hypothetical protein